MIFDSKHLRLKIENIFLNFKIGVTNGKNIFQIKTRYGKGLKLIAI